MSLKYNNIIIIFNKLALEKKSDMYNFTERRIELLKG